MEVTGSVGYSYAQAGYVHVGAPTGAPLSRSALTSTHVQCFILYIRKLLPPYRWKPRLNGHIVFILGLGVSLSVHNIVFSVTRNDFQTVALVLYYIKACFTSRSLKLLLEYTS